VRRALARFTVGRTEPIPFQSKADMLGVGKAEQDAAMLDETAAKRRQLDSEVVETEEIRQKRLVRRPLPAPGPGVRLALIL